jgi:cytidyltransferase-like protein
MRIYCDGVFDLFHRGHLEHFKKIHKLFSEPIELVVGIISDELATTYKRKPIFDETKRHKILSSCIYVDETFVTNMLIVDELFLNEQNIDYVVHAFNDPNDKKKQNDFFEIPIKLNKFIEIPYNEGISTSEIINENYLNWEKICIKNGQEGVDDLCVLNELESTKFDAELFINHVINVLKIENKSSILEIGCGSGLLSKYLNHYDYIGIDYSSSLVAKHVKLLDSIGLNFNYVDVIFKDNFFDYTIADSILEYLPNMNDLDNIISEIERVSKKGIYIGNIGCKTRSTMIEKTYFTNKGYVLIESLYDADRYDVVKIF